MDTRQLTVRVDEGVLLSAKRRALDSGVTMTEVVNRLLASYVTGAIRVAPLDGGDGLGEPGAAEGERAGTSPPSSGALPERAVDATAEADGAGQAGSSASQSDAARSGSGALEAGEPSLGSDPPPARRSRASSPASSACPMDVPKGVKCKTCGKVH